VDLVLRHHLHPLLRRNRFRPQHHHLQLHRLLRPSRPRPHLQRLHRHPNLRLSLRARSEAENQRFDLDSDGLLTTRCFRRISTLGAMTFPFVPFFKAPPATLAVFRAAPAVPTGFRAPAGVLTDLRADDTA